MRKQRTSIQILESRKSIKSFLEEDKDCMLAEAKSEVRTKNAEQSFSTVLVVIFRDNLIPIIWKSIVLIKAMKNIENSEKEYFEKFRSEVFMKWEN